MEQQGATGPATIARGFNAVHVLPADWSAAPAALGPAFDRVDPDVGAVQLLVIVASEEAAIGVVQAIIASRAGTGPRVVAATGASRVGRILRAGAAPIVVGASPQLLALLRASALKLEGLRTVAIAWVDEILATGSTEDLEAVLAEVPKDAGRVIITAGLDAAVEDFIERHARRAPRFGVAAGGATAGRDETSVGLSDASTTLPEQAEVSYVSGLPWARPAALRRVLDEIDPPSAVISVRTDRSEQEARDTLLALGYEHPGSTVRVARGRPAEHAALLVLYDMPHSPAEWNAAVAAMPSRIVALLRPHQVTQLRGFTPAPLKPLAFAAPVEEARAQEAALRAALRRELGAGAPTRELLTLEPLLAEFDGAALAAAALRMLERERVARERAVAAAGRAEKPAAPATAPARPAPGRGDRGDRPRPGGRPSERPRGGFPERARDRPRDDRREGRDGRAGGPPRHPR